MLYPKRFKFKKQQKGRNKGIIVGMKIVFGLFAIKALTRGRIKSCQIESARKVISKIIKKYGKLWIRIFPNKPITKKPLEVRMGKGKGDVEYYVYEAKPGSILYEIGGNVSENLANNAFKLSSSKLPIKTIFCKK